MSDYFTALLRSSGMALASGAARSVVERAAPVEGSIAEQPLSRPAPTSDALGEPGSQPALARAIPSVQPAMAPSDSEPASSLRRDAIPEGGARNTRTLAAAPTPAAPLASAAAKDPSNAQPPLAQALIDAALRWVATGDAPHRQHSRTNENEPAPSAHVASLAEKSAHKPEAPITRADRVEPTIAHERDTAPLPIVHEGSMALLPLRSETPPIAAARAAAALDHDPPLDVSIGAIHVRVDAPAAQTVTQALAPRQAVAPRAQPGRSGLARRALRRI